MSDNIDYDAIMDILTNDEKDRNKDRRQRRDWITRMPTILSLLSWAILATVWIILDQVAPPKSYGWLSFFDGYSTPDGSWYRARVPINIAYILLMVSIGLCLVAFAFNRMRKRRKTDKYRFSVFFVGIVSILAFAAFLVFFMPMNIIGNW